MTSTPRSILLFSYYVQRCSEYQNRDIPLTYWLWIPGGRYPAAALLYANPIFSFLKNLHIVVSNHCTHHHSPTTHKGSLFSALLQIIIVISAVIIQWVINSLWFNFCSLNDLRWTLSYTWYTLVVKSFVHYLLNHLFVSSLHIWDIYLPTNIQFANVSS